MSTNSFFRWKPVSVSLVVLAVVYLGAAVLNLFLVRVLEQRGDTRHMQLLLWGAFWNVVVGALCLCARHFIKLGGKLNSGAGAIACSAALLLVMRTWLAGLLSGHNPFPVFEAVLVWPWLIYAAIYAVTVIQQESSAERGAASNGGLAAPLGNSKGLEGPPSVT